MFFFDKLRAAIRRFIGAGSHREQLRRMCMGNMATVERLMDYEKTRSPGISETEACRRALRRCERDNR